MFVIIVEANKYKCNILCNILTSNEIRKIGKKNIFTFTSNNYLQLRKRAQTCSKRSALYQKTFSHWNLSVNITCKIYIPSIKTQFRCFRVSFIENNPNWKLYINQLELKSGKITNYFLLWIVAFPHILWHNLMLHCNKYLNLKN